MDLNSPGERFLLLTAFTSGMSIMALEMSASRLLAPYFGSSLFVWTNIIGVTMISLSIGYYYGGKLADNRPAASVLFRIILLVGGYTVLIPFIAPPVMKLSLKAITAGDAGLFYGSLLGTVLLFAPPLSALAGVAPFTIRLTEKGGGSGYTSGRVFAISTVGSILGTFLPVLLFIPLLGTRNTLLIFGVTLLLIGAIGIRKKRYTGLFVLLLSLSLFTGSAKPDEGVIFEKESVHNYIQVIEKGGARYLKLNEGFAYHSIYRSDSILVNGVWDYFNVLPYLNKDAEDVLIIGLAGGTVARQYRHFFPWIKIDGVEIDGEIIKAGKSLFDMEGPNLTSHHMDGRVFLTSTEKSYDIVLIDAYKQPYIPFHLTTREFFEEVRGHLKKDGLVAINVASLGPNSRVLRLLKNTMASVYENVYVFNPPGTLNYIILALPSEPVFELNAVEPGLKGVVEDAARGLTRVEFDNHLMVLSDDRAPVEVYTDLMIFDYIMNEDTRSYTGLFE